MPEYLAPGVYVEEIDSGAKPIEGVSTSTAGMVGVTERGPEGIPTLVTSFSNFLREFGGYLNDEEYTGSTWYLPHAVEGFFTNGGKRLYVIRVLPTTATTAGITLFDQGNTPDVAGGPTFTRFTRSLAARVGEGDQLLLLDDSSGVPANGGWAIIQDDEDTEYIQLLGAPAGVVAIATPVIATLWGSGTTVEGLDAGGIVLGATTLISDVEQGEFLLPVNDANILAGSTTYWIGNPANPGTQESHAAIANGALGLSAALALNHNPNAPVFEPTVSFDHGLRTLTDLPLVGNTSTLALDNRLWLVEPEAPGAGQLLRVTNVTAGLTEVVRIQSVIAPRSTNPDPGTVLLEPLANAYAAGHVVEAQLVRSVATLPPVNTTTLALDTRRGLEDAVAPGTGQLLRVTNVTAVTTEVVRIQSVDGPRGAGTDPGNVVLETPLANVYNAGDQVEVEFIRLVTTLPPVNLTTLELDNRMGLVSGQQLRIVNVTQNTTETIGIQSAALPRAVGADPGNVNLDANLANDYIIGDEVEVELLRTVTEVPPISNAAVPLDDRVGLADAVELTRNVTTVPPVNLTTLALDNRTGLVNSVGPGSGQLLRVANLTTGTTEEVLIQSITGPRGLAADPGNVVLETPLSNAYNANDQVEVTGPGKQLLRVRNVTLNTSEDLRVQHVPGGRAGGADPGNVVLDGPLNRSQGETRR